MEQNIDHREDLFHDLNVPVDPYLFCSAAGRVLYASEPLREMVGEDLTGRNLNDLMEDRLAAQLIADCMEGRTRKIQCKLLERHFTAHTEPMEENGGMQVILFPLNDPKEDRWCDPEQELFTAREIYTEAGALLASLDRLAEELPEELVPMLDEPRQRIFRMTRLGQNLQDSSAAKLRSVAVHYTELDMAEFLGQLLEQLEPICQQSGVQLHGVLPEEPLICHADPKLLRRMVCNLLSNSLNAQPRGGAIELSLKSGEQEDIIISVSDRGQLPQGGQPDTSFRRRKQEELYTQRGMALGLPLTSAFAEAHGGRLLLMRTGQGGLIAKLILPSNLDAPVDSMRDLLPPYGAGLDPVLVEMSTSIQPENYRWKLVPIPEPEDLFEVVLRARERDRILSGEEPDGKGNQK